MAQSAPIVEQNGARMRLSQRARRPNPVHPRQTLWPATLVALIASGLLTGCGGSGSASASNAAAREQATEQRAETKFQDFAKCLREHGVNARAISHPGGGHGLKVGPGSGGLAGMEAAEKTCARYRPEEKRGDPSPQQKVELEEGLQKFAKCMREHGIKVEASTTGGGARIQLQGKPGSGGPNPESPGFKAAQNTCRKLLPGGGP
jgi:hypothetical protein